MATTSSSTSSSNFRSDQQIQRDILAELRWDARVLPNEIGVSVKNGVVTLSGWVDAYTKKRDAERVVSRLTGVRGVSNLLEVKPRVAPHELRKTIEDALVRSVRTDAKHITVEVEGSKVILKGKVRSWVEKNDAERAAFMAPGITSVDNRITISN